MNLNSRTRTVACALALVAFSLNLSACNDRKACDAMAIFGGVLAMTVVGAIIGIPLAVGFGGCGYSAGTGERHSRDVLSEIETLDESTLTEQGRRLAHQYALTEEQGLRLVRMSRDFALTATRSDADLADFSRRLYGVSPQEIRSAVVAAQLGQAAQFNELIEQSAAHFGTTPEKLKNLVNGLYGTALNQMGVNL